MAGEKRGYVTVESRPASRYMAPEPRTHMEKFTTLTGIAAHLPMINVDTDMIIPKQFLKTIKRTGLGKGLFAELRYDEEGKPHPHFVLHKPPYTEAKILITGENFGCGSSREHAPWALEDHGFRAVIAPSFADIFRTNCTKIGLLPVQLTEDQVQALMEQAQGEPGARAAVDLERQVVVAPDGSEFTFTIDPVTRERLLNGWDDIALTLTHEAEITAYEADREREGPVTTPFA
jgi:3-isopropylmalate/(R)-2-methylmalate dehydratase small subunit